MINVKKNVKAEMSLKTKKMEENKENQKVEEKEILRKKGRNGMFETLINKNKNKEK